MTDQPAADTMNAAESAAWQHYWYEFIDHHEDAAPTPSRQHFYRAFKAGYSARDTEITALKAEVERLNAIIEVGRDMVEQMKDQGVSRYVVLPGEFDDFVDALALNATTQEKV